MEIMLKYLAIVYPKRRWEVRTEKSLTNNGEAIDYLYADGKRIPEIDYPRLRALAEKVANERIVSQGD